MKFKNIYKKIKIIGIVNWQKLLIRLSLNRGRPFNKPTSIIIDLTQNCVLHCQQCHLWKTKAEKQMTFDEAKIIIDRLHQWLGNFYLFFTGGEPFINKDLPKIIKYAESIGIVTHVNSNAFLIDKKLASKILDSRLSAISISLDGAKASTHDFLRGTKGAFKKVINAIKLLKTTKSKKNPNVFINTVIMKTNLNELGDLIKLSKKQKTDGITFQCLLPTLASKQNIEQLKNSHLWPDFNQLKSVISKIIKTNNKNLLTSKENLEQIIDYYQNPEKTNDFQCEAGINNFIINRLGEVRLCFALPEIGNILKTAPKEIWLGQKAQKQRGIIKKCNKTCKVIVCNKFDTNRLIEVENHNF